jgi:nicotinate dehydrogenase subunit A
MANKSLNVNGKRVSITYDDPQMPLLYVLRDNLGLRGPRFGCGLGQCGACTVHIDGAAVRSCITPLTTVNEKQCACDRSPTRRPGQGRDAGHLNQ